VRLYSGLDESWDMCTRTMEGHSGPINSVGFSPDGTCIVSGSGDNTLRLWDSVSGAHLNTLSGHSGRVFFGRILPMRCPYRVRIRRQYCSTMGLSERCRTEYFQRTF
jgi:WD40 repeat protein